MQNQDIYINQNSNKYIQAQQTILSDHKLDHQETQSILQNHQKDTFHTNTSDFEIQLESTKTIEQLLQTNLGGNGKYQKRVFLFFSFHFLCISLFLMIPGWLFSNPDFICGGKECEHIQYCKYQGIKEVSSDYASITSYFELYCKQEYLSNLGKSLPYIGGMFGLLFLMPYSDNNGRKKALILAWGLFTLGIFFMVLVDQIWLVMLGLFLAGIAATPILNLEQIYINEVTSGKFKSFSVGLLYVVWSVSELFIYPFTSINTNWKSFIFTFLLVPALVLNIFSYFIYETPSFLLNKNIEKCTEILNKIQNVNTKNQELVSKNQIQLDQNTNTQKTYNAKHLFKYQSLRKITIFLTIISMGGNAALYGIQFSLDIIGSDFGKNSFYAGIADIIGYIIANILANTINRKYTNIISLFLTSFICISFVLFSPKEDSQLHIQIALIMFSRLFISIFTTFLALWRTELYPTTVRSIGIGFVGAFGIVGAQIVPLFQIIGNFIGVSQIVILGIFCIISCIPAFFLKETLNKQQLNQIQEIQQINSNHYFPKHNNQLFSDQQLQ